MRWITERLATDLYEYIAGVLRLLRVRGRNHDRVLAVAELLDRVVGILVLAKTDVLVPGHGEGRP